MPSEIRTPDSAPPPPWWSVGHVWLVVGGPAAVVVASFVTYYLAVSRLDPVVDENYYQKGVRINQSAQVEHADAQSAALTPAQVARNHAATGGLPAVRAASSPR